MCKLSKHVTVLYCMCTYKWFNYAHGRVGRGGRVLQRRTFGRGDRGSKPPVAERRTFRSKVQNHLLPFQNLGKFVHPTLLVSFGRDTKSRWSLLPGVYARGSKRSHTGGKCVTCCGLRVVVSISNPPIPGM